MSQFPRGILEFSRLMTYCTFDQRKTYVSFIQIFRNTFGEVSLGRKSNATSTAFERPEETHLCRYSVVIVHNISMLRSQALLTCPGHISTICKAYRELGPGATLHRAPDESFSGREIVSPAVMILQFMARVLYCLAHLEGK